MNLQKIFPVLFLFYSSFIFAIDGRIDLTISIPDFSIDQEEGENLSDVQVEIGSFFIPNHQPYPLTPDQNKKNATVDPIFSTKEAFAIFDNKGALFYNVPRGKLLSLHLTINKQNKNSPLFVSIGSEVSDCFMLMPENKQDPPIKVKVFLIDQNSLTLVPSKIEVLPNQWIKIDKVEGKTLFIFIPNKGKKSFQTVNFNNYNFPLRVTYHAP
jgi:hypothetical protein